MNKKIAFIPGWMYSSEYCKLGIGINVWKENIDFSLPIEYEYLIGHSMGAAVALKIWSLNKDKKLFLVNPLIEQKSVWQTFVNWCKFIYQEGISSKGFLGLKYLPQNIKKLFKFPEENYWEILKEIPRENIKILHGEYDLFLCNKNICLKFKEYGFDVIEVSEAGHDWHKNFDNIINKIVNN
jgi:hypothetical protein